MLRPSVYVYYRINTHSYSGLSMFTLNPASGMKIYRQLMDQDTPTLAMAASDAPVIAVGKDEAAPAPVLTASN